MTDASFEEMGRSNKALYGPRKLLLCGFAPEAQPKFKTLLQALKISNLPLVWAGTGESDQLVGNLLGKGDGSGEGASSALPRAIIAAGIEEAELHLLMAGCRQSGMQQALWAVLTPTSENWPLSRLLDELNAEKRALSRSNET